MFHDNVHDYFSYSSGYMSPEYAILGQYSTKSDVFSFGVLLLEIISGKRNTNCNKGRASQNLIGQVRLNKAI